MRRRQDEVLRIVQHGFLALGGAPPQDEHDGPVLAVERHDRRVREFFPADPPVGVGELA